MDKKLFDEKVKKGFAEVEKNISDVETDAAVLEIFTKIGRSIGEPDTDAEREVSLAQGKIKRVKQVIDNEKKNHNL